MLKIRGDLWDAALFLMHTFCRENSSKVDKRSEKIVILALKTIIMVTIIKKGTPKKEAKRILDEAVANAGKKDLRKYAGILKTDIDPLEYQKSIRNEWE